ncbi:MAG: nucleoside deaminase [Rhizobiales bacterium]|nr:nucleoside deaminase [Hyphomicrobiales bacterium]
MSDNESAERDLFMGQVLELCGEADARGDCPVASIIVRDGQVIGRGSNRVATGGDPTAHAEVEAIRDAARNMGTGDLSGATLYSAMEPCPMCCWAIKEAKIGRIVLGARHAGMRRIDYGNYSVEKLIDMTCSALVVVDGVRVAECEAVRRGWKHWVEPPARVTG